ncbi:MAG: 4-hydroxy-tetrahydrodipicolinate synthase [Clostridiales bacterium]|jgi:4-hydroxy-tetrahydrodipicolinate synthase|nr:4-hydroxy-tetrahydrodipicolinate synthase [Clostridiales bacterium]
MSIFRGSGVAIVTPFNESQGVDYKAYERLVNFHLENHTDSIIVCGTTGEASTLTEDERASLIKLTVDMVNKKIPVIAGTGSNNTLHSIHLTQTAEKCGADGILNVTPYYNKATQKGLISHFTQIADSTSLPIILYSVASRTGTNILPKTVYELSKVKNIVGIKEASGDISQIAEIASLCDDSFDIYSGNDDQIVPIMSLGGVGVISTVANIIPQTVHDICAQYDNGNRAASLKLQLGILNLIRACFIEVNPIPVKEALGMMGMLDPVFRSPMCPLEDKNRDFVREQLKAYALI